MTYDPNSLDTNLKVIDSITRTSSSLECIRQAWDADHAPLSTTGTTVGSHSTIRFVERNTHPTDTNNNLYVHNDNGTRKLFVKLGTSSHVEIPTNGGGRGGNSGGGGGGSSTTLSVITGTLPTVPTIDLGPFRASPLIGTYSYIDEGNGIRTIWGEGRTVASTVERLAVLRLQDSNGADLLRGDKEIFASCSLNELGFGSQPNIVPSQQIIASSQFPSNIISLLSGIQGPSTWVISSVGAPAAASTFVYRWMIRGMI